MEIGAGAGIAREMGGDFFGRETVGDGEAVNLFAIASSSVEGSRSSRQPS